MWCKMSCIIRQKSDTILPLSTHYKLSSSFCCYQHYLHFLLFLLFHFRLFENESGSLTNILLGKQGLGLAQLAPHPSSTDTPKIWIRSTIISSHIKWDFYFFIVLNSITVLHWQRRRKRIEKRREKEIEDEWYKMLNNRN